MYDQHAMTSTFLDGKEPKNRIFHSAVIGLLTNKERTGREHQVSAATQKVNLYNINTDVPETTLCCIAVILLHVSFVFILLIYTCILTYENR